MQKELEQKEINQTINFHCGCGGGGTGVVPTIGENGNWFIGEEDTGVKAQGEDGKSAYGVAVEAGFTGTVEEWLESLKGAAGEAGTKGEKGDPGVPGPAGSIFNYDTLFDGKACTANTEYNLAYPVTNYSFLLLEVQIRQYDGVVFNHYNWLAFPKIADTNQQRYVEMLFVEPGMQTTMVNAITYAFTSAYKLNIRSAIFQCNDNRFESIGITKIYGIK